MRLTRSRAFFCPVQKPDGAYRLQPDQFHRHDCR
jgi:hypothetical protein